MFESTLAAAGHARHHRPDPRLLGAVVLVHATIAATFVAASVWRIERVAAPPVHEPYIEIDFPPLEAPIPPPHRSAAPPATSTPATSTSPLVPVAPPTTIPSAPLDASPLISSGTDTAASASGNAGHDVAPNGSFGGETIYQVGDGVTAPEVLRRVEPEYPRAALFARKEALVVVEAEVSPAGEVRAARIVESSAPGYGFEDKAIGAIQAWRFSPALRAGKPVAVLFRLTIRFRVR